MPFTCPVCHTPRGLMVVKWIELPPDSRSDEITLQVVGCLQCGMRALAVYEESRRGSLGSECYDHTGYIAPPATVDAVIQAIQSCPDVKDCRCSCAAHWQLAKTDPSGRWDGIARFGQLVTFRMEMSG